MKRLLLWFTLILLSGCATQRRCELKFPVKSDTVRITTVKDTVIYRDTVVYIPVHGEVYIDSVIIPCAEIPGYKADTVKAETELAKAFAWWQYPTIKLLLIQKDTTLQTTLKNALKDSQHWRSEYERITNVVIKKAEIPKIYKIALWVCITLIVFTVVKFALKFIK